MSSNTVGVPVLLAFFSASNIVSLGGSCSGAEAAGNENRWHLTNADPQNGGTVLTQVADLDTSDPAIAGLMLRCGTKSLETILVLIEPLPPGMARSVKIETGLRKQVLPAEIIPTGAGLRIPIDVESEVAGNWHQQEVLRLIGDLNGRSAQATFSLTGLSESLTVLRNACVGNRENQR